jgi:hypothetical protein
LDAPFEIEALEELKGVLKCGLAVVTGRHVNAQTLAVPVFAKDHTSHALVLLDEVV